MTHKTTWTTVAFSIAALTFHSARAEVRQSVRTIRGPMETLRETKDSSNFLSAAEASLSQHLPGAVSTVVNRAAKFPAIQTEISELLVNVDTNETVPLARTWARRPLIEGDPSIVEDSLNMIADSQLHFNAAMILLRHGDRARREGLNALRTVIDGDDEGYWIIRASEDLFAVGTPETFEILESALDRRRFEIEGLGQPETEEFLLRLFVRGSEKAREFLRRGLENEEPGGKLVAADSTGVYHEFELVRGDAVAEMIARWSWGDGNLPFSQTASPDVRRRQREALIRWLDGEWAAVEEHRPIKIRGTHLVPLGPTEVRILP